MTSHERNQIFVNIKIFFILAKRELRFITEFFKLVTLEIFLKVKADTIKDLVVARVILPSHYINTYKLPVIELQVH